MKYTDTIPKSLTDTDYAGGTIFKQLVEEGTLVDFHGDIKDHNCLIYQLNKYCYTCRTLPASEVRAYILIDTIVPTSTSTIRLIVCNGMDRKSGKVELLEVLPAPDPEYPIYGNDWMHKLAWFLKAKAIGINTYDTILKRCEKGAYLSSRYDLRHNEIKTLEERLKFYEEFTSFVKYFALQAERGSVSFGCQQRSRNYNTLLSKIVRRMENDLTASTDYWGIITATPERFDVATTYPAILVNAAADAIHENNCDSYSLIASKLLAVAKDKSIDLSPYWSEEWTTETFTVFRNQFMQLTDKYYFSIAQINNLPYFAI